MTIVKSQLMSSLAKDDQKLSDKQATHCVQMILDTLADSLSQGDRIEIRGFGSFNLHYRAPRTAHNPKTGQPVRTEAKYSPHFKPGKELRERINTSRNFHEIIRTEQESDAGLGGESQED